MQGVVNSIGVRRDAKATGALQILVEDTNRGVASEALMALGMIATDEALATVRRVVSDGPVALRVSAADAALTAVETLSGDEVVAMYDTIRDADLPEHLRTAATYGAIVSRGDAGVPLLVELLGDTESAMVGVALRAARELPGDWQLVAVSEDWCGDAVNTLPVIARLADEAGWQLRVFGRDDNPDLMEGHLTNGRSQSIPVVIAFDEDFNEVGWWGPRPEEIQSWVMAEGLSMSSPERYKVIRRWYARDRGKTTISELLGILSSAA